MCNCTHYSDCCFYCENFLRYAGQREVLDSREVQPASSEIEVGGVRVIPLGEENSGEQEVMLRAAAGYEVAADFLKQSLYGGRQKRIPG